MGRQCWHRANYLAENNTVIMLMLSRLTLNSRKTSLKRLKGISQIEFTQLIGLPTRKANGTRKDRKKKNKFIRS